MAAPNITRISDLPRDQEWRVGAAVFRYQENGHYTVLLLKRATGSPTTGWWNTPTGPVRDTDETIDDSMRRIIFEQTGLGLQGYHNIYQVASLSWGSEEQPITKLNFVIHDKYAEIVATRLSEFSEYQWVEEERIDSLSIPVAMQDVIRTGFELHREGYV
jgi:8-oxo-dGTP pyrophosphatase MutT (NUDIX family)